MGSPFGGPCLLLLKIQTWFIYSRGNTSCKPTFFEKSIYSLCHILRSDNDTSYPTQWKNIRNKHFSMLYACALFLIFHSVLIINNAPIETIKQAHTAIKIGTTYICPIWTSWMICTDTLSFRNSYRCNNYSFASGF